MPVCGGDDDRGQAMATTEVNEVEEDLELTGEFGFPACRACPSFVIILLGIDPGRE